MLPFVFLCVAAVPLPPGVSPDLFPGAADVPTAEVQLAGIAALYPGHILHAPPLANDPANTGRAPLISDLPRNTTYLRIYDLGAAHTLQSLSDALAKYPAVILDLRYVVADEKAAAAFAQVLSRAGLASAPLHGLGEMPEPDALPGPGVQDANHTPPVVLAMVNGKTAGPLEAWLEVFQEKESMLAVGTTTAGQPGIYDKYLGFPDYYIIKGELQPESGSLVGIGLKPRFLVEVTPEQNYLAYTSVERGTVDIASMLRHDRTTAVATPAGTGAAATTTTTTVEAADPVLQRAVDVVAALQVLGRVPSSTTTGAAKAPANATSSPVER